MLDNRAETIAQISEMALRMRRLAIRMARNAGPKGVHLGPGFSIVEIMATLYAAVLRHDPKSPRWPERDRFILSKGHGVLGLYTALVESGYFPAELLERFDTAGSPLAGHPSRNLCLGIEASTGSLGHGLSIGVGIALASRVNRTHYDTYVLVGDGECNEGTIWEAAMSASHYKLDNLAVVVDRNGMQADGFSYDILDMGDMAEKWRSFGWAVREVNGHDAGELLDAFDKGNRPKGRPYAIIAHTVKGKGVSFFENRKEWHHYRGFSIEQAERALLELGAGRDGNSHASNG